jgi:hypothetical protein
MSSCELIGCCIQFNTLNLLTDSYTQSFKKNRYEEIRIKMKILLVSVCYLFSEISVSFMSFFDLLELKNTLQDTMGKFFLNENA